MGGVGESDRPWQGVRGDRDTCGEEQQILPVELEVAEGLDTEREPALEVHDHDAIADQFRFVWTGPAPRPRARGRT